MRFMSPDAVCGEASITEQDVDDAIADARLNVSRRRLPKWSCLYVVVNILTNRFYIGQTRNFRSRVYLHVSDIGSGRHGNARMVEDCRRYGIKWFRFGIISCLEPKDLREQEWQALFTVGTRKELYNISFLSRDGLEEHIAAQKTCQPERYARNKLWHADKSDRFQRAG